MTQSYETKVLNYVGQAAMIIGIVGCVIVAVFLFLIKGDCLDESTKSAGCYSGL